MDGHGTEYYDGGGKKYEGDFVKGKWEGQGVWYYENGNIRTQGSFSNDLPCGQVVRYYENGVKKYEGSVALFTNQEGNTSSSAHGYGIWYDEKGKLIYKGNFKEGKLDGYGTYYKEDGVTIEHQGQWKDGDFIGK